MPTSINARDLLKQINLLRKKRREHLAAIDDIDSTFHQLGIDPDAPTTPGSAGASSADGARPKKKKQSTPTRVKKKVTGKDFVLSFITARGGDGATTDDVNQNWKSDGRRGSAYNVLYQLKREGKIKAVNIKGKGSRYITQ